MKMPRTASWYIIICVAILQLLEGGLYGFTFWGFPDLTWREYAFIFSGLLYFIIAPLYLRYPFWSILFALIVSTFLIPTRTPERWYDGRVILCTSMAGLLFIAFFLEAKRWQAEKSLPDLNFSTMLRLTLFFLGIFVSALEIYDVMSRLQIYCRAWFGENQKVPAVAYHELAVLAQHYALKSMILACVLTICAMGLGLEILKRLRAYSPKS